MAVTRRQRAMPRASADDLPLDVLPLIFSFFPARALVIQITACCRSWRHFIYSYTKVLRFDSCISDCANGSSISRSAAAIAIRRPWSKLTALTLEELDAFHTGLLCGVNCTGFAHVTTLHLTFADRGSETDCVQGLGRLLRQMASVEHLSLDMGQTLHLEPLLKEVSVCSRLRSLAFGADREEEQVTCSAVALAALARACKKLTTLSVQGLKALDDESLSKFSQLTTLQLSLCSKPTWTALLSFAKLHTLHIRCGCHGFDTYGQSHDCGGDGQLNHVLRSCTALTELTMYGIDAIDGSGFALPEGVGCRLRSLALNNCIGLTNTGLQAIVCHPLTKLAIEEIDLECHGPNGVDAPDDVIEAAGIIKLVTRCPSLQHLNINSRPIKGLEFGEAELRAIVEGCPTLLSLVCADWYGHDASHVTTDGLPSLCRGRCTINQPWAMGSHNGGDVRNWFEHPLSVWRLLEGPFFCD